MRKFWGGIKIVSITQKIFHIICIKNYRNLKNANKIFKKGLNDSEEFFDIRFNKKVNYKDKAVIDIGCALGYTCIYMALNGAKKVVGVDISKKSINFAKENLKKNYPELLDIVEFKYIDDLGNEKFDIVLSKDSFEHYKDPENFILYMKQLIKKDGNIVIGFGPLWKSPYGGHIDFMTKFPWAQLIFPEKVIMAERRRFRPNENAESFDQILGGLNKMTLKKYLDIVKKSDLEIEYFKTNVTPNRRLTVMLNFLRKIPFCKEYFTFNLYSILHSTNDFKETTQ